MYTTHIFHFSTNSFLFFIFHETRWKLYKNKNRLVVILLFFTYFIIFVKKQQTSYFSLCLKRNHPQILKNGCNKDPFLQCVCYWYYLLCFFILCDNWETLLFILVCRYFEIVSTAMLLLFLKPVFCQKLR